MPQRKPIGTAEQALTWNDVKEGSDYKEVFNKKTKKEG